MSKGTVAVTPTQLPDSSDGKFRLQETVWHAFKVVTILPTNAPAEAVYLPSSVYKDGVRWWDFKHNHRGYRGQARLEWYGNELFLLLCSRRKYLDLIIPVKDLPDLQWTDSGDYVGGRDIKERIRAKEALSVALELEPVWTVRETQMRTAIRQEKAAAAQAVLKAEEEEKAAQRAAARRAKFAVRALIEMRKPVLAFTVEGTKRRGYPVVEGEWQTLGVDNFCVLVKSFDQVTGQSGEPLEAFVTKKDWGGHIVKDRAVPVSSEGPGRKGGASVHQIRKVNTTVVKIGGEMTEVVVAATTDDARQLLQSGVGMPVIAPETEGSERWPVYTLAENGQMQTVTTMKRTTAKAA